MRNEKSQALAKAALALLAECDVPPTPENYQLFFAYAAGENPAVTRIINDMIDARRPFSPELLKELRERSFQSDRTTKALEAIGKGVSRSLGAAIAKLEQASQQALDYGNTLSAAHGELGGTQSPESLRDLIGSLVSATEAMETRSRVLETELQKSSQQVNELRGQLEKVQRESMLDPLTGVANRKAFDSALDEAIAEANATAQPLSLFMCDIDRFKVFNDTWGHQTGDQVLRLVASCLSDNTKGHDTAARFGGEEFAVIVRHARPEDAARLAEHLRHSVENKKLVKKSTGEVLGSITMSIGVAHYTGDDTPAGLIGRADACLYRAKNTGRNRVVTDQEPHRSELEIDAA